MSPELIGTLAASGVGLISALYAARSATKASTGVQQIEVARVGLETIKALQDEIARLRGQLTELRTELDRQEGESVRLRTENRELRHQLDEMELTVRRLTRIMHDAGLDI